MNGTLSEIEQAILDWWGRQTPITDHRARLSLELLEGTKFSKRVKAGIRRSIYKRWPQLKEKA